MGHRQGKKSNYFSCNICFPGVFFYNRIAFRLGTMEMMKQAFLGVGIT